MSTKQTRPNAGIPIAGGVAPSQEYLRWFADLDRRVGGINALSNVELQQLTEEVRALWQAYEDNGAPFKVLDEGANVGVVRSINFTGSGVTATLDGTQARVQVDSPVSFRGSAVLTVPAMSREHVQAVSVPGVVAGMVAIVSLAEHEDADENHESMLHVIAQRATCAADSVSVFFAFGEPTGGPVRINYVVS